MHILDLRDCAYGILYMAGPVPFLTRYVLVMLRFSSALKSFLFQVNDFFVLGVFIKLLETKVNLKRKV